MKKEEEIKEEIKRHKDWLKKNKSTATQKDIWLHECILAGLNWVIK